MLNDRRRCVVVRGLHTDALSAAARLLEDLEPEAVKVFSDVALPPWGEGRAGRPRASLGGSFDAVVVDLHGGIDADLIGVAHGLVRGGGALLLLLPAGHPVETGRDRLAVEPWGPEDVGSRFERRLLERVTSSPTATVIDAVGGEPELTPLKPARRHYTGTAEQAEVVERVAALICQSEPRALVLTADRGRGKSAALGLALKRLMELRPDAEVVVTASRRQNAAEVLSFAGDQPERLRFVRPREALELERPPTALVVDEAAQLSVDLLRQLSARYPGAHLAFASTVHGYEGTGRGFALRFVDWLERQERPLTRLTLKAPIRWAAGDPLEAAIFDALALDAEPAPVGPMREPAHRGELHHRRLDRDALARDEVLLRDLFGLLVQAHYRTTPADLHRMLDAPNLALHATLCGGRVAAACVLAHEGGLDAETCDAMAAGAMRIRGHALPDTLVSHTGHTEAGRMRMIRSVRIAAHPALRRLGLASRLVDAVHETYAPDLFGTLFGATPALLRFRRAVGYRLVRLGTSSGARTGEPSAVMVYPVSPAAHGLTDALQAELARDLPEQLALMAADGQLPSSDALVAALLAPLPEPAPLTEEDRDAIVRSYAFGARHSNAAALAIRRWVGAHRGEVHRGDPAWRALIEARVLRRRPWREAAEAGGYPTVRAAMRAMRRGFGAVLQPER